MYKILKTKSDCEPWWFLENWEEDIVETKEFDNKEDALTYYKKEWDKLKEYYPFYLSRKNLLATFWDTDEKKWCEECDEYLQDFHSILLLKDGEPLSSGEGLDFFEQSNTKDQPQRRCQLK